MENLALEAVKTEIASTKSWLDSRLAAGLKPLEEETQRIARGLLQAQASLKEARRADLLRSYSNPIPRVPFGKYAGMDRLDLSISRALMEKQVAKNPAQATMLEQWRANLAAAMDSTTAGSGDELVPTGEARELWMDVNLQSVLLPLFTVLDMPTNPFDIPVQLGDVNWYPGTQNVATKSTAPGTGKKTLTAYEIVGMIPLSYDLEEDAVIAIMADILLNADTTVTNGINSDGATIAADSAGKGHWLLGFDGLRHLPLVDATGQANDKNAAADDAMFSANLKLLGKYGIRPSAVIHAMDIRTYIQAMTVSNFRTVDKFGPHATVLNGQLGAVGGIPVIVPETLRLTATDGLVTDGVAGTVGQLLTFNRSQWMVGFKRQLTIEADRDTKQRQSTIVASMRIAFSQREATIASATHTALQYDITGV